ncbi:hypothetical protein C0993_004601 [Termitomyces sp. T159_Od127]|nr:hypothetical protein C0993_004601 [Termitomyces sp. T159_Od127]
MFAHLPPELYGCIVEHVDPQTVLALTRCLPHAGIPLDRLFRAVAVRQPETAPRLYRRLRAQTAPAAAHLVQHLAVDTWAVDADVLANLLPLLPSLRTLARKKGHILPIPQGTHARTAHAAAQRPQGSYFDSTLHALSAWPRTPSVLSIVQDSDSGADSTPARFAQPIVFFRLDDALARLLHARASRALTALRIRVPARPVAQPLAAAGAPARLTFLDASASRVSDADIDALLARLPLRHLVLDACAGLLRQDGEWWAALGRRVVLVGVKRAREREKAVRKTWEEAYRARVRVRTAAGAAAGAGEEVPVQQPEQRRAKRGRRGLASATVTLRRRSPSPSPSPSPHIATPAPAPAHPASPPPLPPKIHIVPPLPSLESLSLSPPPGPGQGGMGATARAAFVRGWDEGMRVLWDVRARMGTTFARVCAEGAATATAKARFFVFKDGDGEAELAGLDEVRSGEEGIFLRDATSAAAPPVLCLAGPDLAAGGHEPRCGHVVGRELGMECLSP